MTIRRFTMAAFLLLCVARPGATAGRILLDPAAQSDPAYRFAAAELAGAAGIPVVFDTLARDYDVVVGASSPAARALAPAGRLALPSAIRPEGYAIRQLGLITVVAGADARGDIYGTLWLAERTRLDPTALRALSCLREPAFPIRELNDGHGYREPPGRGTEGWLQECLKLGLNTYSAIPSQPELSLAKSYHLSLQIGTGPFASMPVDDIIARYGDEVSESPGQLCPLKPKVWELYRAQLRETLTKFPEVDYVRPSLSDFPARYHVYDCKGPNCRNLPDAEALRLACQAAWDVVVGEFQKTLVISSWGNPPESYPLNMPEPYRYIMDGLPDHGIISLVNNTQHDFYLTSPFNPVIGTVKRPQGLKFEVTPEYAGEGFLPVYIGPALRERLGRAVELGADDIVEGRLWEGKGLWTRDVLWTRANLYALFRASWEPQGDPWEWARDWAALTFGPDGASELADALGLSEELARRTFWVHGYSGAKGHAYAITHRSVFTDGTHYFRWTAQPHLTAYRQNQMRGQLAVAVAEADDALALRDRMMARWHAARARMRNPELRAACDRDFEHFSALADVLNPYEAAMLLWAHTKDAGLSPDELCESSRECVKYARRAAAAYSRYRAQFDLYRDAGLTQMLAVYVRDCAALTGPRVVAAQPGGATKLWVSVFNNSSPGGLAAAVRLDLPAGWTATPTLPPVQLAYGQRRRVVFEITPPRAGQGDVTIVARLIASPEGAGEGREIEQTAMQVKVIGLAGAIAASGRPARPTTICPRAARPPVIDGVLAAGEWAAAAPAWVNYPLLQDASGPTNTYVVDARWMWDEKYFYLSAQVADEVLQTLPVIGSAGDGDFVAPVFDLDGDRRDDYDIRLVSFPDRFLAWPIAFDRVLTSSNAEDRPRVEPLGRDVALALTRRADHPGYVIEAAIPWSLLGGFRPAVGEVIGFAFRGNDTDKPGPRPPRFGFTWPSLSPGRDSIPTEFADLVFTDSRGAAVP